ncbi:MAG: SfiI family type II restriction endonuclease [Anaerolineae bacterium]|nr:SfiI family type II restriction endonuclease [Anaerolineae bacterium]
MLIDPHTLQNNPDRLAEIEKASLRLVTQALWDYRTTAQEIFRQEADLVADIGEDITREALDRLGMARIDQRLFGKIDYKRARYVFHPEYAIKQALFIDSKAETMAGQGTATLQISQTSMRVRQIRTGETLDEAGGLPFILDLHNQQFITTTLFVKYNYDEQESTRELRSITVAALPNGLLQARYNPDAQDTIWLAGRNAPTLGEDFRVRLSFRLLRQKAAWRVQVIDMDATKSRWNA